MTTHSHSHPTSHESHQVRLDSASQAVHSWFPSKLFLNSSFELIAASASSVP